MRLQSLGRMGERAGLQASGAVACQESAEPATMAGCWSRVHREDSSPAKLAPGWAPLGLSVFISRCKEEPGFGAVRARAWHSPAAPHSILIIGDKSCMVFPFRSMAFVCWMLLFFSEFL